MSTPDQTHDNVDSNPEPTHVRYLVLGFVAFASGSAYLTRHCIAAANTKIQEDLGLSDEQMGWVFGLFSVGYFLCQVPGGWLGNRFGTRTAFPAISTLWSLLTLWSSAVASFVPLLCSRFAFGAAQAGLVPLSAKVVNDWMPLARRGFSTALIGAFMSVGGAVTFKLTGILLRELNGDWRTIFRLYSLVGVVWAIAFYFLFRTKPRSHSWVNESERELIEGPAATEPGETPIAAEREKTSFGELTQQMIACRSMWAICIQAGLRAAGYWLLVSWFTAFLEYAYGIERNEAAELNMYPLLYVIAGTLLGGTIVDRLLRQTGSKWVSRSLVAIVALSLCGICTLFAAWSASVAGFVVLMSLGSFFAGFAGSPAWSATMDIAGRQTSIVMGVMNMAGNIGGFLMSILLGYLVGAIKRTDGDWNLVIYLVAAIYFSCACAWFWVDPNESLENHQGAAGEPSAP